MEIFQLKTKQVKMDTFHNIKIKTYLCQTLNTHKDKVRSPLLSVWTVVGLKSEGVIELRRISIRKKDGKLIHTQLIKKIPNYKPFKLVENKKMNKICQQRISFHDTQKSPYNEGLFIWIGQEDNSWF